MTTVKRTGHLVRIEDRCEEKDRCDELTTVKRTGHLVRIEDRCEEKDC